MTKAKVVLGLAFGDEGKGVTTDYLCQKYHNSIVVRSTGGHQAGHTVEKDGKKHVFSSFGAGTLRGIPSYFSEHTTLYPLTFLEEKRVLRQNFGIDAEVTVHPLTMITTPYDVAYNRVTERMINKHGSVGLGVGATMKRNKESPYKLYAIDMLCPTIFIARVKSIKDYYIDKLRAADSTEYKNSLEFAFRSEYMKYEMEYFNKFSSRMFNIENYNILPRYINVIFEGSQGILLDMDHGVFPNVTYGNTTSKNAIEICKKIGIGIRNIDIYYVTRCYQTRHGNGFMTNSDPIKLVNNEHEINVTNEWQGDFRVSDIDYNLINHAIRVDNIYSHGAHKHLVVTCLDQRPDFEFNYNKIEKVFTSIITNNSYSSTTFKEKLKTK